MRKVILGTLKDTSPVYNDHLLKYKSEYNAGFVMEWYEKNIYPKKVKEHSLKAIDYLQLDLLILSNYLDMTFSDFVSIYALDEVSDIVYIRSKLLGVCFNENAFTSGEDKTLVWLYYYLGKWSHIGVAAILEDKGYKLKSVREYQERLDYLGVKYFKTISKYINPDIKLSKSGLPSLVHPSLRYTYTEVEKKIAKAMYKDSKGDVINFLPWKDINEIYYVATKDDGYFEWYDTELKLSNNITEVRNYLELDGHTYYHMLMASKEIKVHDSRWSVHKDNLLKKDRKAYMDIEEKGVKLFPSLPEVPDLECKMRLDELKIVLRWNKLDIDKLIENAKLPPKQLYEVFEGFRSPKAIDFAYSTLERVMNKRLCVLLDERDTRLTINEVVAKLRATGQSEDYIKHFIKCF